MCSGQGTCPRRFVEFGFETNCLYVMNGQDANPHRPKLRKDLDPILRTHSQRSCSLNQSPIPPCCYWGETSCSPSYLAQHVFTQVHCGWFPPSGVFITVPTTLPAEDPTINHSQLQVSSAFQGKAFPWKVPSKHLASQTPVTSLATYCLPIPLTPEGASCLWVPHLCYRRQSHHQPAGFASWLSQFPDMIISPPIPSQSKSQAVTCPILITKFLRLAQDSSTCLPKANHVGLQWDDHTAWSHGSSVSLISLQGHQYVYFPTLRMPYWKPSGETTICEGLWPPAFIFQSLMMCLKEPVTDILHIHL